VSRTPSRVRRSIERRGADVAQFAAFAGAAAPDDVIELLHAIEQTVVGPREAELEIAAPRPLGAQPRPRPVGAADVDERAVDDDRLEVDARAGAQLQRASAGRRASVARNGPDGGDACKMRSSTPRPASSSNTSRIER